jgi:hypothetical protein
VKTVTVTLTEDEAKQVASVLHHLTAKLQYRASRTTVGRKYRSWRFWRDVTVPFDYALGMTHMDTSSPEQQDLLDL